MNKYKSYYKVRLFRISDNVYKELKKIKKRDETWNLVFKKLIEKNDRNK